MTKQLPPLELYKLLPQTNCGRCYLPSCLAFAAAAVKGEKRPNDCPFLDQRTLALFPTQVESRVPYEIKRQEELQILQKQISAIDLSAKALSLGGRLAGERLSLLCLGKEFFIDKEGEVSSACHTHTGLTIPLLTYLLHPPTKSLPPLEEEWIAFRKLNNGAAMAPLFEQKCEGGLQKIADNHQDLFETLVSLFSGDTTTNPLKADMALTLFPLPKVPILICYWQPEDGLESVLRILFNKQTNCFLESESVYSLVVGLVMMFEKIAQQHI